MTAPTNSDAETTPSRAVVVSDACSRDLAFDEPTPHAAIEAVIAWLGIGYQSTITRRSDGKRITIRITEDAAPSTVMDLWGIAPEEEHETNGVNSENTEVARESGE